MNTFNDLSPQDQFEVSAYVARNVLAFIVIVTLLGVATLVTLERSTASLRYGWMMIWTCICVSAGLNSSDNISHMIIIYALGLIRAWVVLLIWRRAWPIFVSKWRSRNRASE